MGSTESLTFVDTKQLIDELARRHDAFIILGMKFKTENNYEVVRFHQGHRYVCLGMLDNMKSLINEIENKSLSAVND